MKKILLSLLVFVSLNANGWVNGNTLVKWKVEHEKSTEDKSKFYHDVGAYHYYIFGVLDSIEGILVCTPNNTNGRQIFAIVSKFINDNPDKWNKSAWNLVYEPLKKTFPCKKKK